MFRKCQRQWYFGKRLASATAKDESRREAYLLSKLCTIHAWRGKIVDTIIEKVVVPVIAAKGKITLQTAKQAADRLFDTQLDFALKHRVMAPGFKASDLKDDWAAFYAMEYGTPPTEQDIAKARAEVHLALTNLFQSQEFHSLKETIKSAYRLAAQCAISFPYAGATVRAVPDLICLFRDAPPLIIDWKVHHFGVHDYYQQLVAYAITLTRSGPHKRLPAELRQCPAHEVRLVECQLLTNEARNHIITEDDVDAVQDRMAAQIRDMLAAVDGRETKDLLAEDFPTTSWPGVCATCNFKRPCWKTS